MKYNIVLENYDGANIIFKSDDPKEIWDKFSQIESSLKETRSEVCVNIQKGVGVTEINYSGFAEVFVPCAIMDDVQGRYYLVFE